MEESKGPTDKAEAENGDPSGDANAKPIKKSKFASKTQSGDADDRDVLFKVGPLVYRLPGKQQKMTIGAVVLGLNALLVLAVILYFYNPGFHEFIYTVGRG